MFWVLLVVTSTTDISNNDIMWAITQTSVSTKSEDSTTDSNIQQPHVLVTGTWSVLWLHGIWMKSWESNKFWETKLFQDFLWNFGRVFNHTIENQFQKKPSRDFLSDFSNVTCIINHKMSQTEKVVYRKCWCEIIDHVSL